LASRWQLFINAILRSNWIRLKLTLFREKPLAAVDANHSGEMPPQLPHFQLAHGIFWINCANESSKVWLMRAISGLGQLWEGAELAVADSKDLPKRPRVPVHIPDTSEVTTVVTRLRIQNPELNTANWLTTSHKVTVKEQTLAFSIDPVSFNALAKTNFKAFWGLGRVIFWTLKDEKKKPEAESVAGKFSSQ
jgi:hypothetical protein